MVWPSFSFIFVVPGRDDLPESEEKLFVSLAKDRRWEEAVKLYEVILRRNPGNLLAMNALAKVAYENRDYEAGFRLLSQLVKKNPENPHWLNNFAVILVARGDLVVARGVLLQALSLAAEKTEPLYNLGCLAVCENDLQGALQSLRQVVASEPHHRRALFALSRVAKESGLMNEAIACCRKLVELAPEDAEFRQNLGLVLLKNGNLREGFEFYESRWQAGSLANLPADRLWQGQALSGKTIMVWDEQGLGDTINFARYLPLLQEQKGGKVVVAVQEALVGLLACSFPELKIVARRDVDTLAYDFQVPFLNLPSLFLTQLDTIPAIIPYLEVGNECRIKWQMRLGDDSRLRVGVVWAGNPNHTNDSRRSISLEIFARFFVLAGCRFYSLQKDQVEGDADFILTSSQTIREHFIDLSVELIDFQDTAAILENLDLLISVDTSVAHLAGALACPTWLLLPFDADWRWLLERDDSPWYPSMRLFRQPQPGDWGSVIDEVSRCLHGLQKTDLLRIYRKKDFGSTLRKNQ